mgnify:FL=1
MSNRRLSIFVLAALSLLGLTACNSSPSTSSQTSSSSSSVAVPSYKIKSISTKVDASNYTYDISFKTDKTVTEDISWYLSDDTRYDTSDSALDVSLNSDTYSFDYDGDSIDFYVLMVGTSDQEVYAKANVVLPSFNLSVEEGTGDDAGKDVLTFEFLDNDHSPNDYIDQDSVTIYSSSSSTLDTSTATVAASGLTLTKGMDAVKVDAVSGDNYYFVEATLSGQEYVSQAFEKGKTFGSDLVALSKATVSADGKLTVEATATGAQNSNGLVVTTSADSQSAVPASADSNGGLSATFDLSTLSKESTQYTAYWKFGAGLFEDIPGSILDLGDQEVISGSNVVATSSNIYEFSTDEGLGISFSARSLINVLSANYSLDSTDSTKVDFNVEGLFDTALASNPTTAISNPTLLIGNDNDPTDFITASLTLDTTKNTFEASADISGIQKNQRWYGVYIFLNSDDMKDENDNAQYSNASYVLTHDDADNLEQTITIDGVAKYFFANSSQDNNNLKIVASDLTFSPLSAIFKVEDNKVLFELSGTAGPGSIYSVVISADGDPDGASGYENRKLYQSSFTTGDDGTFTCDVDVTDIVAGANYDIYIFQGTDVSDSNKRIELTHDNFLNSYRGVAAYDGYIYCVKDPYNGWYKVEKDTDTTKVYDLQYNATANDIALSGVLNTTATGDEYIGLFNTTTGEYTKSTMTTTADGYTATIDPSTLGKGTYDVLLLSGDISDPSVVQTIYPDYLQNNWKSISFDSGSNTVSFAQEDGSASNSWALSIVVA